MGLRDEILEQPAAAERLLSESAAEFAAVAAAVHRRPAFAVIAARGTSDNAGLYLQYLLAVRNGIVTALAAPSTITLYGARPRMAGALVVGLSQSGRSPDIIAVVEQARDQGAVTVALTNDPGSPLAEAAEHAISLRAGPEKATAATKTYTAELLASALLSLALDPPAGRERSDLDAMPGLIAEALTDEDEARRLAADHAARGGCLVLGRGYGYATAREWALKLQELAQVPALAFSAADFEHGPLALAEPDLPVLAAAPDGAELEALLPLLRRLRSEHRARLLVVSDDEAARSIDEGLAIPTATPRWLAPVVEIIPAQLYTYHLTVARGLDPDQPRTISKVTRTR